MCGTQQMAGEPAVVGLGSVGTVVGQLVDYSILPVAGRPGGGLCFRHTLISSICTNKAQLNSENPGANISISKLLAVLEKISLCQPDYSGGHLRKALA